MKKFIFIILYLLTFNFFYAEDFIVIKGKVIESNSESIKILDLSSHKKITLKGKFPDLEKGNFIKIKLDKNKKILKIKKINFKSIRERIRRIGKFKHRHGFHKFNRFNRGRHR